MQLGIHLPQAGSQATPELIRRHASQAEALGLSDAWVSEHIIVPRKEFPRSPLFYDPLSPVFLTTRPWWSVILGFASSARCAWSRSCVPSSFAPIRRE